MLTKSQDPSAKLRANIMSKPFADLAYRLPAAITTAQPPIARASSYLFADSQAMAAAHAKNSTHPYTYGTHSTPTSAALAAKLKMLENAKFCWLTGSGLAAIALVNLALLQAGDEVWLP